MTQPDLVPSPLAEYQARCARGELAYQVDPQGRAVFPPRIGFAWRTSAGLGTVYAASTISQRGQEPYNVALVDLDEGFRLMTRIEGVVPDAVRIGLRVRVRFVPAAGDQPAYPVFEPTGETA